MELPYFFKNCADDFYHTSQECIQPRLTGTTPRLGAALGSRRDPATALHGEAFYRIALNDHIDITPAVVWLTAPNHDEDNSDIFFGALRTTFRF